MMRCWQAGGFVALVLATLPSIAAARDTTHGWTTSWATAQQTPDGPNALPPEMLRDATLRQIVRLSRGGPALRVRLSNRFGTAPLTIHGAYVGLAVAPGQAEIVAGSDRPLRFNGKPSVTIPAGADAVSDSVPLPVGAGSDVGVSLHFAETPAGQTTHSASRANSFIASGDQSAAVELTGTTAVKHWFQLAAVEVAGDGPAVIAVGDSITDGYGIADDSNSRWPDALAERLRADPALAKWSVANLGISGNRILADGLGPNLLSRFDRDVLGQPGVRVAIVLEGVNDLGVMTRDAPQSPEVHCAMVNAIEHAYRDLARRAHTKAVKLVGGTITPFVGSEYYHPGPETEADRQAINSFIRNSGTFDAVVDFDAALRDPARPDRLSPAYDSGDHLHPSTLGYRKLAETVPLTLFGSPGAAPTPKGPALALTFDDLPAHGPLPQRDDRLTVADTIIAALTRHHAPAFGFVNGGFGTDDAHSPTVLAHWRAAGLPLGNHTFDHRNLAQSSAVAFVKQVEKNEATIAPLMQGKDWKWFRYPFLSEGDTAEKRDAVRGWLTQHGYKAAAVTMSFGDYAWNDAYARCVAKRDTRAIDGLERSYLAAAESEAKGQIALSRSALGRDVPHVLLMHLGAFDARMIEPLLKLYEQLGLRFVPLAEAEGDPFYGAATDLTNPGPTPTLEAAAAARGISVPAATAVLPAPDVCA